MLIPENLWGPMNRIVSASFTSASAPFACPVQPQLWGSLTPLIWISPYVYQINYSSGYYLNLVLNSHLRFRGYKIWPDLPGEDPALTTEIRLFFCNLFGNVEAVPYTTDGFRDIEQFLLTLEEKRLSEISYPVQFGEFPNNYSKWESVLHVLRDRWSGLERYMYARTKPKISNVTPTNYHNYTFYVKGTDPVERVLLDTNGPGWSRLLAPDNTDDWWFEDDITTTQSFSDEDEDGNPIVNTVTTTTLSPTNKRYLAILNITATTRADANEYMALWHNERKIVALREREVRQLNSDRVINDLKQGIVPIEIRQAIISACPYTEEESPSERLQVEELHWYAVNTYTDGYLDYVAPTIEVIRFGDTTWSLGLKELPTVDTGAEVEFRRSIRLFFYETVVQNGVTSQVLHEQVISGSMFVSVYFRQAQTCTYTSRTYRFVNWPTFDENGMSPSTGYVALFLDELYEKTGQPPLLNNVEKLGCVLDGEASITGDTLLSFNIGTLAASIPSIVYDWFSNSELQNHNVYNL